MQLGMSFDYVHDVIQCQVPLEFMFLNNFKPSKNAHDGYQSGSEDDTQKMEFETLYVKKCMLLISKISVDHQVLHQGA
jgi:hypothetical protein